MFQITHNPSVWELYAKLYLSNDNIKDTEKVELIRNFESLFFCDHVIMFFCDHYYFRNNYIYLLSLQPLRSTGIKTSFCFNIWSWGSHLPKATWSYDFISSIQTCNNQTLENGRRVCTNLTLQVMMTSGSLDHLKNIYGFIWTSK